MLRDLPRNAICSLQLFMLGCLLTFWSCKPEFNSMHGGNCKAVRSGNKISYFSIARGVLANPETYRRWLKSTQSPWAALRLGNFSKRKIYVFYKDRWMVRSHRISRFVVVGQALNIVSQRLQGPWWYCLIWYLPDHGDNLDPQLRSVFPDLENIHVICGPEKMFLAMEVH